MSFTVYRSSAGSGKTFTLVKEYLVLTLQDPYKFRNILAITFTNKAANEMKERVVTYLEGLAGYNEEVSPKTIKILMSILQDALQMPSAEISANAQKVLSLILHNYSDFAISTIDSFVHKIIRTFAFDLQLPLDFNIEMDENRLIGQAVDILISHAGEDEKLTQALVQFTELKTESESNWQIEKDLAELAKTLLKEDGQVHVETLRKLTLDDFYGFANAIKKFLKIFEEEVSAKAATACQLIHQHRLEPQAFHQSARGIWKYFHEIAGKNISYIKPNSFVRDTIENDKWASSKADISDKQAIESIKEDLYELFSQIQAISDDKLGKYLIFRTLIKNIYPIGVLNEIQKIIDEIRKSDNLIHISEFNKRIAAVVSREPVPFIFERIGEKYHHFMIDEFQDTSVLQWHNLVPLVHNSLSSGNHTTVVGDGKQAIYRWRSGDVEQFAALPYLKDNKGKDTEIERKLAENYHPRNLTHNFRSKAEIVDFNNHFFSYIKQFLPEQQQIVYDEPAQEYNPDNTGGYLRFEFLEPLSGKDADTQYFEKVHAIICELDKEGYQRGDIAILCRGNENGSKIARYLTANNIPVVSAESLLLHSSPEVTLMISLIKAIANPSDIIACAEVVTWVARKQGNGSKLHALTKNFSEQGNQGKNNLKLLENILQENGYDIDFKAILQQPLYQATEKLVRDLRLCNPPDPYIDFFLDALQDFAGKNIATPENFLEWWDGNKKNLSVVIPPSPAAVTVLTIHKAKGLEFPVVIYPYATESLSLTKKEQWVDIDEPELQNLGSVFIPLSKNFLETPLGEHYEKENARSTLDFINLLYVAMTRPEERMYILTKSPPPSKGNQTRLSLPFLFSQYLSHINAWNEGQAVYEFGARIVKSKTDVADDNLLNHIPFERGKWEDEITIRFRAPEVWDIANIEKEKEWGNLVHLVFSRIKYAGEARQAVQSLYAEGLITSQQACVLEKKISQYLKNPTLAAWFQEGLRVMTETDILVPDGQTMRPDRLVFFPEHVVLIDFKTGIPESFHESQINAYAQALSSMGYQNVEKKLVYLGDEVQVVTISQ